MQTTTTFVDYLAQIEKEDQNLKNIRLYNCGITTEDAERLMNALNNKPTVAGKIISLDLSNTTKFFALPKQNKIAYLSIPKVLINLRRLDIVNVGMSSINIPPQIAKLRRIYLSENKFKQFKLPRTLHSLVFLELRDNPLEEGSSMQIPQIILLLCDRCAMGKNRNSLFIDVVDSTDGMIMTRDMKRYLTMNSLRHWRGPLAQSVRDLPIVKKVLLISRKLPIELSSMLLAYFENDMPRLLTKLYSDLSLNDFIQEDPENSITPYVNNMPSDLVNLYRLKREKLTNMEPPINNKRYKMLTYYYSFAGNTTRQNGALALAAMTVAAAAVITFTQNYNDDKPLYRMNY